MVKVLLHIAIRARVNGVLGKRFTILHPSPCLPRIKRIAAKPVRPVRGSRFAS